MSAWAIPVHCACPPDISYVRLFKILLIPNFFEIDSTRLFILFTFMPSNTSGRTIFSFAVNVCNKLKD